MAKQTKPEEGTEEVAEAKKTSFEVFDKDGNYVRTYSGELHGKKAGEFAKEYAGKIGGSFK
jgi:hypothetical protein